jgi:hypothetical protein
VSDDYPGYNSRPSPNLKSGAVHASQPGVVVAWLRRHPCRTAIFLILGIMLFGGLSPIPAISLIVWVGILLVGFKFLRWIVLVVLLGRNSLS